MDTINTHQISKLSEAELLAEMDALYAMRKELKHTSVWGGSFEQEDGARRLLQENSLEIHNLTLELLDVRANSHISKPSVAKDDPSERQSPGSCVSAGSSPIEVERYLNIFPEVEWDRWTGDRFENVSVFGWLSRSDGHTDFVLLKIDKDGPWCINTSSAKFSDDLSKRMGFEGHTDCQRVEHSWATVKAVRLNKSKE